MRALRKNPLCYIKTMKKSLAVFALVMLSLGSLATYNSPKVLADWLIDGSGTLLRVDGSILGDDDTAVETEPEVTEQENPSNTEVENIVETKVIDDLGKSPTRALELKRETEQKKQQQVREAAKKKLESQIELRKKLKEKSGQKSEFELKSEDGKLKIRQELRNENGDLIKKSETEVGDETLHIDQADGVQLEINALDDKKIELIKNRIKTKSEMELKVGEKNEISVTLPNGNTKEISLPDKALENLVSQGIITSIEGETNQYELTAGKNGEPVYEVDGVVEKKLFGIFKMKFDQKLAVAAGDSEDGTVTTGDIVESESREVSPWKKLLERFSR